MLPLYERVNPRVVDDAKERVRYYIDDSAIPNSTRACLARLAARAAPPMSGTTRTLRTLGVYFAIDVQEDGDDMLPISCTTVIVSPTSLTSERSTASTLSSIIGRHINVESMCWGYPGQPR